MISPWNVITKATMGGSNGDYVDSMCIFNNKLYIGTYNSTLATDATAAKILQFDGLSWSSFTKATMGGVNNDIIMTSMCVFNNKLYIGTYNTTAATDATAAKIITYDGAVWGVITKATMGCNADDIDMSCMTVFNNKLYIGIGNGVIATDNTAAKVVEFDGVNWVIYNKATMGAVGNDTVFISMAVFNNKLYIGTYNTTVATDVTSCKVIEFDGVSWVVYNKSTMGGDNTDEVMTSMVVYNNKLHIGTTNYTAATDATAAKIITYDGATWAVITKATMGGVAADEDMTSMFVFKGKLYIGVGNTTAAVDSTAAKIITYDKTSWSVITKSTIGAVAADQYMMAIIAYNSKMYIGTYNTTASTSLPGAKIITYTGPTSYKNKNGNIIGTDQGLIDNREFSWEVLQDILFKYEDPVVYLKSDISGDASDFFGQNSTIIFQNKLYFGTTNFTAATDATGAKLIVYDILTDSWSTITKATMGLVDADTTIHCLQIYDNKLWIGTTNATAATDNTASTIVSYDGTTWVRYTKATMGGDANDTDFRSSCVFSNKLYIGTINTTAATDATSSKVICFDAAGPTWSTFTKATMGGVNADVRMEAMAVYRSKLYIGTYNTTAATDATGSKIITYDGTTWATITKATMGLATTDTGIGTGRAMAVKNGFLHIGCYGAAKMAIFDNGTWSVLTYTSNGGASTSTYITGMCAYNGYLWYGFYDATAATNYTGSRFCRWNPLDGTNPKRGCFSTGGSDGTVGVGYIKSFYNGVNADKGFFSPIVYGGYIWICVYNGNAATDNTSDKIIKMKIPIAHSQNTYMSKGF